MAREAAIAPPSRDAPGPPPGSDMLDPETHRRLEAAVMEIFSSADFHKANLRTVAQRAGVSFSTIYKYYGSKEGLLFAFVDRHMGILTDRMIDHLKGIEDLKEKLRKVFWVQLDYYERDHQLGRIVFLTVPLATWMNDGTYAQKRLYGMFLDVLRKGQEEGVLTSRVRAGVLLDFMHGLVERAFCMWIYRGQKASLADQANQLFELLWHGMANPVADKT